MKITFSYLVTTFFTSHLAAERGLSPNTIASYSDCMKLLVNYLCKRHGIQTEAIDLSMISSDLVLDFLDALEKERNNSPASRNQRLVAIKTFFHFLSKTVPELMHHNEQIQAIQLKRTDHRPPSSLSTEEVAAILTAPDATTLIGTRDRALLQLLYNTGARAQELADCTVDDLHGDAPATVTVTGKGRKTRVIPLWQETVRIVSHYLQLREQAGVKAPQLFLNIHGEPMTRFGIGRRVAHHAQAAAAHCPSLKARAITPHTFRHTTALHLIEANNDIAVVKDWLGHADIKTTSLYIEVSVARKRKALEKLPPPDGGLPPERPQWTQPALLEFLTACSRKEHYVA
ncbi:MAG: integrase [Spirochaetales bacterium]|nr:MAG: integrase [Spirochaetales bacterium]